jgi:hypothetical protein
MSAFDPTATQQTPPILLPLGVASFQLADQLAHSSNAFLREKDYRVAPILRWLAIGFCGPLKPGLPHGGDGYVQRAGQFRMTDPIK